MKPPRRTQTVVAAVAVAVVAAIVRIAAGQGSAAPARAPKPHPPKVEKFKHPKLEHGVLTVTGTKLDDTITLRLQACHTDKLEVVVGENGKTFNSTTRTSPRSRWTPLLATTS
jgi:hypothetical protein